jgi:integral membrane sensor domain MASE1
MFTFNKKYLFLAICLFIVEVLIVLYVHDRIIRPYVGDYLVVILLFCAVRTFVDVSVLKATATVLLFSYLIEVLQYFHLVRLLGLQHNRFAQVVLGSSFEWIDLLAYTLGATTVIIVGILRKYRAHNEALP